MKPNRPPITRLQGRGEAPGMRHRRLVAAHDGIGKTLQQAVHDGLERRPSQHRGRTPCGVAGSALMSMLIMEKCRRFLGDLCRHAFAARREQAFMGVIWQGLFS